MNRFRVTGHTLTGTVNIVDCNSAWDAVETEDGMLDNGYIDVEISSL